MFDSREFRVIDSLPPRIILGVATLMFDSLFPRIIGRGAVADMGCPIPKAAAAILPTMSNQIKIGYNLGFKEYRNESSNT